MRVRALAAALCLVAVPAAAQEGNKASFDCKKAATPVEKAICDSSITAELDVALEEIYRASLARRPAERATLETAQRQWLAARNARCARGKPDQNCLEQMYKARIIALVRADRGIGATGSFITGRYDYREKAQGGEMFVAEMPDGQVLVMIETVNVGHQSPHTCSFSGRLSDRRGDVLGYREQEASKTCGLEIAVTGSRAVISETPKDCFEAAQYYCGAHGYMLGNYVRR